MSVYSYDGSFEGFLSVVYQSYYAKKSASKIIKSLKDISLLDEVIEVVTDNTHAQKVNLALQNKFEKHHYNKIFHTFLCDSRDFEKALYDFIVIGFKDQKKLQDINHPSIYYLDKLEREYFKYLDKMYGFLRFEELEDGSLYSKLEGKFNILPLLGEHFIKRLDGCDFIIHDIKRELAFVNTKGVHRIHKVADFETPILSENEEKFQKLWKLFFKQVSIKERKNLKLQQNWVPLLYRKYMSEFS
jgi:probable DNA metabolism protein